MYFRNDTAENSFNYRNYNQNLHETTFMYGHKKKSHIFKTQELAGLVLHCSCLLFVSQKKSTRNASVSSAVFTVAPSSWKYPFHAVDL